MNIIYLHTSLKECGPTSQLKCLLSSKSKNLNLYVYLIKENKNNKNINKNVVVIKSFFSLIKLILSFKKNKYVIHSSGIIPDIINSLIAVIFPKNLTPISTIRNIPWEDYNFKYGFFGNYLSAFHLIFLRKLKLICCSYELYNVFKNSDLKFRKLYYVDNCCSLESNPKDLHLYKGDFSIKKGKLKLFTLSPIINRKQVLETVILFKSIDFDFHFDIYGSGDQVDSLLNLIKNDTRFKYHGYLKNNMINYHEYDALVSLSLSEGLPNSVIESLFKGIYVILSPIGPHKYLSNFSRKVKILKNINKKDIILHLKFIFENRNNYVDVDKIRKYFGRERMLKEYHNIYNLNN